MEGNTIGESNLPTPSKEDQLIQEFLEQTLEGNTTGPFPGTASLSGGPESETESESLTTQKIEPSPSTPSPVMHKNRITILKKTPPKEGSHYIPEAGIDDNMVICGASGRSTSFLDPLLEGKLGVDGSGDKEDVLSPDGNFESNVAAFTAQSGDVSTDPK